MEENKIRKREISRCKVEIRGNNGRKQPSSYFVILLSPSSSLVRETITFYITDIKDKSD